MVNEVMELLERILSLKDKHNSEQLFMIYPSLPALQDKTWSSNEVF